MKEFCKEEKDIGGHLPSEYISMNYRVFEGNFEEYLETQKVNLLDKEGKTLLHHLCASPNFQYQQLEKLLEMNIFDPNLPSSEVFPNYRRTRFILNIFFYFLKNFFFLMTKSSSLFVYE